MKTRIHVNQHNIKWNQKRLTFIETAVAGVDGIYEINPASDLLPVITVKDYKENRKGFEADIMDGDRVLAKVIYSPHKPLPCGAKVWIETEQEVVVR